MAARRVLIGATAPPAAPDGRHEDESEYENDGCGHKVASLPRLGTGR